jgi:hypothetical protein
MHGDAQRFQVYTLSLTAMPYPTYGRAVHDRAAGAFAGVALVLAVIGLYASIRWMR